jgi:hypothetical protein
VEKHAQINHTRVSAHLYRIKIVSEAVCGCGVDYESVKILLWSCSPYPAERMQPKSGEDLIRIFKTGVPKTGIPGSRKIFQTRNFGIDLAQNRFFFRFLD